MKGTIQKWKLVILLDALLFLSNMTFAKDTINQYTEGNPIDTTAVSISDKTNIPDRLYVDSLSLKRHFIHRIGIEARPGYIFPTSSFFRGENLNWKPIENSLSLHLKYSFQFHPKRGIRRQCPGRGGPSQEVEIAFGSVEEFFAPLVADDFELRRAGGILHVAVAARLVQLVGRKSRAGGRRVGLDGVTFVE